MASRLVLKYGLVAEHDRLADSADALLVTEPSTGSKSRTKGNLYVIVSAPGRGGRHRDAAALVADTIRREYYYDESAGIAICLEKAFRSANRRLRGTREGHSLPAGSIGAAIAVIRGSELYVATIGNAEAYLVRAARLLMPEHEPGEGLPTNDALRLDVWRGEFAIGDSLLLVSRNLTEVVGTEELKNAVVTLHPQSAVEHLHHLFVAAGGEGSDAVLAIEATESSQARAEHRLVPVASADTYASGAGGAAMPLSDGMSGAASAVQGRAFQAREAVGNAFYGAVDRIFDLMPRRRTTYRRIAPAVSRREAQRRAAIAFLSFLTLVLALGLGLWLFPRGSETPIDQATSGEVAFAAAERKVNQVLGAGNVTSNPEEATEVLQEAWADLARAEAAGVAASEIEPLRARITSGLDPLYGVRVAEVSEILPLGDGAQPDDLVQGPDGAAYVLDREARSVTRIDTERGEAVPIILAGDGPGGGEGIGTPTLLATGGPDLLVVDNRGDLWRWRPSDDQGSGTLGPVRLAGDTEWGDDVVDIGTFLLPQQAEDGLYNLYVADPSASQILRYQPTADGSGFSAPTDYLASETEDVADFRQLLIDGDIYALTAEGAIRHESGRVQDFALETPPDDGDVRPDHDYALLGATGERRTGQLYVWDQEHGRVVAFAKADGAYVEQWFVDSTAATLDDVRGMYLVERAGEEGAVLPPVLVWLTPDSLVTAVLEDTTPEPDETDGPSPSESSAAPDDASPAATSGEP